MPAKGSGVQTLADIRARSVPEPNTGCWLWLGAYARNGYGSCWFAGRAEAAHRVSWMLANGHSADGVNILHSCDTPACVNPDHLFSGSQSDNMLDCSAKGRHRNGNDAKTHCRRGHEFTPGNTHINPAGQRICRQCTRKKAAAVQT